MSQPDKKLGVLSALVERFEQERLPRALEIRDRVAAGEKLSDTDVQFLDMVLSDVQDIKPYIDSHPEYQPLAVKAIALYHEIVELGVTNEQTE
jgi:hypothetical protein